MQPSQPLQQFGPLNLINHDHLFLGLFFLPPSYLLNLPALRLRQQPPKSARLDEEESESDESWERVDVELSSRVEKERG